MVFTFEKIWIYKTALQRSRKSHKDHLVAVGIILFCFLIHPSRLANITKPLKSTVCPKSQNIQLFFAMNSLQLFCQELQGFADGDRRGFWCRRCQNTLMINSTAGTSLILPIVTGLLKKIYRLCWRLCLLLRKLLQLDRNVLSAEEKLHLASCLRRDVNFLLCPLNRHLKKKK